MKPKPYCQQEIEYCVRCKEMCLQCLEYNGENFNTEEDE
jgi:hypothetical protein